MKKIAIALFSLIPSLGYSAYMPPLMGVTIGSVYAQSHVDSEANVIELKTNVDSSCDSGFGKRLYIDFGDKELFATALANSVQGKPINIMYVTGAPSKNIAGHLAATCRVVSIF